MENSDNVLWLALVGRESGARCSTLFGIRSETAALAFDMACANRLLEFDTQRDMYRIKAFKYAVAEAIGLALGGKPAEGENDTQPEISEADIL